MRPGPVVGTALLLAATPLALAGAQVPAVAASGAPVRSITVSGTGVSTWPAYDVGLARFAVDTDPDTGGRLTVTAATSDPEGSVLVDGRPVPSGEATDVEGLSPGDEVNVQITDTAGRTNQSFVYLPAGFPRLQSSSAGAGPTDGAVFLGLASFLSDTAYQTAVDQHGVPVFVDGAPKNHDFKPSDAGDGHYTVARLQAGSTNEDAGYQIDELDGRFRPVASRTLDPVRRIGLRRDDTDFHDVELTEDGRVVLVGYQRRERASGATWLDAIIQITDRRGRAQFTWSSKGHIRPSEAYVLGSRGQDYAHINSVETQPNGDLVASFRNVGQVLRIATERRGRFHPGDVVWRLGGERNEFRFIDDPYAGFCAQHDARVLPGGRLLLFDNGSRRDDGGALSAQTADMCPDPADPGGPRVARAQSRVVEYALDPGARTATLVWSHEAPGRYTPFAGNAQRLVGGHTLVGWWNAQTPDPGTAAPFVTEVDPVGAEVWSLTAQGWFSYRAHRGAAPDRIRPRTTVTVPAAGATYDAADPPLADYRCSDRGGSNLAACEAGVFDLTPGSHTFTLTATDRAGNERTRSVVYSVK